MSNIKTIIMKKYFFWLLCAAALALTGCNENQPNSNTTGSITTAARRGVLPGVFSVSESTQVHFSMGNLQYTRSTDTWRFAANQYDYIGTDNVTGGMVYSEAKRGDSKEDGTALSDKIDLFGWSGSTGIAKWGVSTSQNYKDYLGDFVDWGQNAISNGGNKANVWRTLTKEEWKYLFEIRPDAANLHGVASVNDVNGLILLPDNWKQPVGVSFKSGFTEEGGVAAYGAYQSFALSDWQKLEAAGAVFLPASGARYYGLDVTYAALGGYYWSATPYYEYDAWYFYCGPADADLTDGDRNPGRAVRLVQDIN